MSKQREQTALATKTECIGGDCHPEWNWRRPDCPLHGDAGADTSLSEPLQKALGNDGALKLSFTLVILPSLLPELRAEGERLWVELYKHPPTGWTDAEYVRYALSRRLRGTDHE